MSYQMVSAFLKRFKMYLLAGMAALLVFGGIGFVFISQQPYRADVFQEAGHVLVTMMNTIVIDEQGNPVKLTCYGSQLPQNADVVALSDTPQNIHDDFYYRVAIPDESCGDNSGNDYPTPSQLQSGQAQGYIAAGELQEANAVKVAQSILAQNAAAHQLVLTATWRDCWPPTTSHCQDLHASSPALQSPSATGNGLMAWWDGKAWEPQWWHVRDHNGKDATVYGRDWDAVASGVTPPTPTPIPNPVRARYLDYTPTLTATPGQTVTDAFTIRNIGTATWSASSGYTLSLQQCGDQDESPILDCLGINSQTLTAIPLPATIAAGQSYHFALPTVVPTTEGSTYENSAGQLYSGIYLYWEILQNDQFVEVDNPIGPSRCNGLACTFVEFTGGANATNTPTPTSTNTPVANIPTPLPLPTNTPVPVAPTWHPWFTQHRPFCDGSGPWNGDVNHSATDDCHSSDGLIVSQYEYLPAELDLDTPNGVTSYNQSQFQVQVTASMLNPSDHNVFTDMIVQTPENPNQYGGYIVGLNSSGDCYIWQVQSNGQFSNYAVASKVGVGFDPTHFTFGVIVQNGELTFELNGQAILNTGDSLSSGVVGLMTASSTPTSTATLFSDFTLSLWS